MNITNRYFLIIGIILVFTGFVSAQSNQEYESYSADAMEEEMLKYRASESRVWDLIHTELSVSFDWQKRYLNGKAELTLTPYFYEQEQLSLDAKGMTINAVTSGGKSVAYEYDGWKIEIPLDKAYAKNDTLNITIDYVARPYEREAWGNEAIHENRGLYFINPDGSDPEKPMQIWTQGETEANSGWFPTIDSPNERHTHKISITVQDKYQTLSNGLLVNQTPGANGKRTDVWVMDQPHAPYLVMMAIGDFEIVKDQWNNVPLAYWMEPGYGQYAKDIFGNTPEMMTYFSDLLDYPYPWKKYDQIVVRDYVSGAMENTSASLFYERLNVNKRYLIDENWDDIIAHELMHQWFGDLVTCESWSNLTLNEGFASYAEYLWNEYKYGQDEADYIFLIEQEDYIDEATTDPKNLIRYYYQNEDDMFDSHSYNKGAAVLHMLRNYVGDEAFFSSLNIYLKENAFKSVEVAQLRMAFEQVTGEDLNWFFDQWFFYAGHPRLEIRHQFNNDTLTLTVAQTQADEQPVYQMPVFIDIWKDNQLFSYPVQINDAYETYEFPMSEAPDLVIFDSQRQLLAEINHPKSEQEYFAQYTLDQSLYSRVEAMDSLYSFEDKQLTDQLLRAAFEDPYDMIRQSALEYLMDEEVKLKKYESEVIKLTQDPSSHVRSYAMAYLGRSGFEKYRAEFDKALNDSSYLVVSATIAQFIRNDEPLYAEFLAKNNKETDLNIVVTLAEYYNRKKDEASYEWFQQRINGLDGNTLFFFIQAYAEKLLKAPMDYKKSAIPKLEDVARNNSNYLARFSAFQALILLSDVDGVDAKVADIRKNEKDPRLTELYKGI